MPKENLQNIFHKAILEKQDTAKKDLKKIQLEYKIILDKFREITTEIENKGRQIADKGESSINQSTKSEIESEMQELQQVLYKEYQKSLVSLKELEEQLKAVRTRKKSLEAMITENSERN